MAPVPVSAAAPRCRAPQRGLAAHAGPMALAAAVFCAWAPTAGAAPEGAPRSVEAAGAGSEAEAPGARRSYLQSAYTKVRPEAYLRLDAPAQPPPPRVRAPLAERRDTLMRAHYGRLASLDALAEECARTKDNRLAEQVETARRRDTQQYFLAMQALKIKTLAAWAAAGP